MEVRVGYCVKWWKEKLSESAETWVWWKMIRIFWTKGKQRCTTESEGEKEVITRNGIQEDYIYRILSLSEISNNKKSETRSFTDKA